jgi:GT2 family glycosyltransferase
MDDSFNIGIWAWELAYFREDWASTFGALDEIWVPSEFCRRAIAPVSLLLGKPVIATNYSGNADFMNSGNSYPIEYRLMEIGQADGPYPPEGVWAEPNSDDLIAKMHAVMDDRREAEIRAARGRETILQEFNLEAIGTRMKARFDSLEVFASAPKFIGNWKSGANYTYRFVDTKTPRISVVVPVYNIEPSLLSKCVESVAGQTYRNWELILHDDGSTSSETIERLRDFKGVDPRIKVSFGGTNRGIAGATNAAIELSSGDFIPFLDNDDELAADALEEVAQAIHANSKVDLLYSDEDKIDFDGNYCDDYFKPDWSPEHLESVMYLLHLLVVRRSILLLLGGLRSEYSCAQDYDLALRVSRVARQVVHIPKVLYHWRMIPGSAGATVDAKPVALQRAELALQDHVNAGGRQATVFPGLLPGVFRVRDAIPSDLPVTLVIFTDNRDADVPRRGKINLFDHFLESILTKTQTVCTMRILAVDNGNLSKAQRSLVEKNGGQIISYDGPRSPFNFSKKANFALKHVKTEIVILLNDDMEVSSSDWIDALVEVARRPATGIVGARLLYPDDRIQHCGVILGINNHAAHIYHQAPSNQIGYNGYTHLIRNYLAVTGACIATRMSIFDEVGGFDEIFAVDYTDIDLCLRVIPPDTATCTRHLRHYTILKELPRPAPVPIKMNINCSSTDGVSIWSAIPFIILI